MEECIKQFDRIDMKGKIDKVVDAFLYTLGVLFTAAVVVVSAYAIIALALYFLECIGVC